MSTKISRSPIEIESPASWYLTSSTELHLLGHDPCIPVLCCDTGTTDRLPLNYAAIHSARASLAWSPSSPSALWFVFNQFDLSSIDLHAVQFHQRILHITVSRKFNNSKIINNSKTDKRANAFTADYYNAKKSCNPLHGHQSVKWPPNHKRLVTPVLCSCLSRLCHTLRFCTPYVRLHKWPLQPVACGPSNPKE